VGPSALWPPWIVAADLPAHSGQTTIATHGRFKSSLSHRLAVLWQRPPGSPGDVGVAKTTGPTSEPTACAVRLYVAVPARADLGRVLEVLGSADANWLGRRVSQKASEIRPAFPAISSLRVGPDHWATFRKSAIVGLGAPKREHDGWVVPIEWRAATLAPLFPVLVGHLRVSVDRIELDGRYAPPGGSIGYVLDRALPRIAARGTGRWFFQKVLRRSTELRSGLVAENEGAVLVGSGE
jgi:hypothetical protein